MRLLPRKVLFLLLLLMITGLSYAQSGYYNYIELRAPRTAISSTATLNAYTNIKDSVNVTYQYIDGLGRPLQTVQQQGSPSGKDMIQPFGYDQESRDSVKYMPYTISSSSPGSYRPNALTNGTSYTGGEQYQFYQQSGQGYVNTQYPYSGTGFEPSEASRVQEQGAPGTSWQLSTSGVSGSGHTAKLDYESNDHSSLTATTGSHMVALYTAIINSDQSRTLTRAGNNAIYTDSTLTITITKDENWNAGDGCMHTTEEYKDLEGHIVLKRTYDHDAGNNLEELSTYYVYDDRGNLCFVLPPGLTPDANAAIPLTQLDKFAYVYRYDDHDRLTQKKLPGKGWEFMIYNTLDQVVMTQTANQRNQTPQQWTFTKYDGQGRVVITGLWLFTSVTGGTNSTADANLDTPDQTYLAWLTNYFATTTHPKWERPNSTTATGYDGLSDPLGESYTFLTINYYDKYTGIPGLPGAYDLHNGTAYSNMTTGLPTATKTYVLNTTDALWTVTYYDDFGDPVRVFKQHYLGGTTALSTNNCDDITTIYNFNKQPISTTRTHYDNISGVKTQVLQSTDTYTYDHMGRRLNTYSQIKDHANVTQAKTLIEKNIYNELGQLKTKDLHAKSPYTSFLQTIDYRYNTRGWLISMNNANLDMTDAATNTTTNTTNDQFGEQLYYDVPPAGGIAQYNGNIASVRWMNGNLPSNSTAPVQQGYDYRYDTLNRVRAGVSVTGGSKNANGNGKGFYDEYIKYNSMGNITSMSRYDQNLTTLARTQIDSLTYINTGNQVTRIDNAVTGQTCDACFIDGVQMGGEYLYDLDGNMTRDKNKNITPSYNILNLPQTINISGIVGADVYIYDAAGTKLRKINTAGSNVTATDYIDGIQYDAIGTNAPAITFIQTEEGRIRWNTGTGKYVYEYDLKDHLGDTRVTFNDDGTGNPQVLQLTSYYPFGATIGSLSPIGGVENHYLYNHKEQQKETGLYDYGARFYDPVIGRWTSVDPKAELLEMSSPYVYALNSPVTFIDKDGELPIFIGGRVNSNGERASASYWDKELLNTISSSGIPNPGGTIKFVDGDVGAQYPAFSWNGQLTITHNSYTSEDRQGAGEIKAEGDWQDILSQLEKDPNSGKIIEKIQIYTHSRGGAFGIGYTDKLIQLIKEHSDLFQDASHEIDFVYNMADHQSDGQTAPDGVDEYSVHHNRDKFSGNGMQGVKGAFSTDEKSPGILGAHANSSFVKDTKSFLKAWQESKGDSKKLIDDFVSTMQSYGIKVTVKQ